MKTFNRILLAEDDPCDLELTLGALTKHHLASEIFVVRDGAETLDYLYRRKAFSTREPGNPVVILLDLKMPKIDGAEVLKEIKSSELLKAIPVVILTSSRETQDLDKCYKLGANAYVVKPVKFAEFLAAIRDLSVFWALINEPPSGSVGKI